MRPQLAVVAASLWSVSVCLAPAGAAKEAPVLKPVKPGWKVAGKISKDKNISGIACVTVSEELRRCVLAVDEKFSGVLATLEGHTIRQQGTIRLAPKQPDQELDAEGAAYDPATKSFYVIGSYGMKRHTCAENPSAYRLLRFPVDPTTGKLTFDRASRAGPGGIAPEIQTAKSLRLAFLNAAEIGPHVDKCLGRKLSAKAKKDGATFQPGQGANVEGLAVQDGRVYVGFRGPVHKDTAYIAVFDLEAVFTRDPTAASIIPVRLGAKAGVRDLAAAGDALLILSGPEDDEPGKAAIHHLDLKSRHVTTLGRVRNRSKKAKPEALLLLAETPAHYRVLILSDGVKNGEPTEFHVPKNN